MPPEGTLRYDFRPMTVDDLPLMARWLRSPHVARWWDDAETALARIEEHIVSADAVEPFVVLNDGEPIGYLQSYDIHREEGHPYQDQPAGSVGIDQFIGEAAMIGKGQGPRLIDVFVRRLFDSGVPRIVVDPDPANARAIRAYQKAGFRAIGDRATAAYGPVLIMVRDMEPAAVGQEAAHDAL